MREIVKDVMKFTAKLDKVFTRIVWRMPPEGSHARAPFALCSLQPLLRVVLQRRISIASLRGQAAAPSVGSDLGGVPVRKFADHFAKQFQGWVETRPDHPAV
ncbi:hypothetical protein, partial [Streptomyces gibsoniae]